MADQCPGSWGLFLFICLFKKPKHLLLHFTEVQEFILNSSFIVINSFVEVSNVEETLWKYNAMMKDGKRWD